MTIIRPGGRNIISPVLDEKRIKRIIGDLRDGVLLDVVARTHGFSRYKISEIAHAHGLNFQTVRTRERVK